MISHKLSLDAVKAASDEGIPHAKWLLSRMYRCGIGVEANEKEGFDHLFLAQTMSKRALHDFSMMQIRGKANNFSPETSLRVLADLGESGFARTEIGETLVMHGSAELVERGYNLLKIESLQCFNWKARYLVLLCDIFKKNIPETNSERLTSLTYLYECEGNQLARHAIVLSCMLGRNPWVFKHEDLVENLLEINTPESSIDAWQILWVPTFKGLGEELRRRAFVQVASHAETGHLHAKVIQLFELLNHAHPKDEGECAVRLLKLMRKHPELHSIHYDYPLHQAKQNTPGLAKLMLETMRKVAESKLAPYAKRTLAIELNMVGHTEEAEKYFLRAMDLGVEESLSSVAWMAFKRFDKTGEGYVAARFWAEAHLFDSPESGHRSLLRVLESRKKKTPLTNEEILETKTCLEFLSSKDDEHAKRELALVLLRGNGPVLRDPKRGLELLKAAAETDGRAMYELAHVYQAGVHVPQDMNLAQHFFDEAAKHGHSNAQYDAHLAEQNAKQEEKKEEQEPAENEASVRTLFPGSSLNESQ
jgi:TPR repeat protein